MGQGYIFFDVVLFIACALAAFVNIKYAVAWYSEGRGLFVMRLIRIVGWSIFTLRFAYVLGSTGDLIIPLPSLIALSFLAAGEIAAVFLRGKVGKL